MTTELMNDKLLTREESAKFLRVTTRMLDDLRILRRLSYIQVGRKILLKQSELQRFIEANTVMPEVK